MRLQHAVHGLMHTCCVAMQVLIAKWLNGTQSWTSLRSQMELWQVSVLQTSQCSGANCCNYLLRTGHSSLLVSLGTCWKHCAHFYLTHQQVKRLFNMISVAAPLCIIVHHRYMLALAWSLIPKQVLVIKLCTCCNTSRLCLPRQESKHVSFTSSTALALVLVMACWLCVILGDVACELGVKCCSCVTINSSFLTLWHTMV